MPTAHKVIIPAIFLVEALFAYFLVAQRYPISGDDYSYLYQAKLFANGKLWARDPIYDTSLPFYDCLETYCFRDDQGRRFSKYAPGWPVILAAGVKLHAPWLVDPVLGAVLVFLMLQYADRRLGNGYAKVVAWLVPPCFFLAYYAASSRAHIAAALFLFSAFLLYDLVKRRPNSVTLWLFAAGALLGYSSVIRYVDWIPLTIWIGVGLLREKRLADVVVLATGFILVASGNLVYDALLSGDPLEVPSAIHRTSEIADRLIVSWTGFLVTAVRLANLVWVFPPAVLLVIFLRRWWQSTTAKMYVTLFLMIVAIYFFYPASAGGPGPRYLLAYFPFLILGVACILQELLSDSPLTGRKIQILSVIALFLGNLVFVAKESYTMYWRRDLQRTTAHIAAGKNIFLLKTGTYKTVVGDLTRNPPALSSADNLYFAWCTKTERDALLSRFPDYKVFVYEYPGHLTKSSENP
jgi:hypothetical protein